MAAATVPSPISGADASATPGEDATSGIITPAHHMISISVTQARNLVAADTTIFGRSSDPYVVVDVELEDGTHLIQKSRVIPRNLNPVFNDRFDFDTLQAAPKNVSFRVMDHDKGTKHDFIGSARVPVTEEAYAVGRPFVWLPLQGVKHGELQVQIAARIVNPLEVDAEAKLDYIHSIGLLTLRIEELSKFLPGPVALKKLGKTALERGEYMIKCVLQHGLRKFNSKPMEGMPLSNPAVPLALDFDFNQDCR